MEENFSDSTYLGDFASTVINYALHSICSLSPNTWIMDTDASNHMCTNFKLITNPIIHKNINHVYLP